MTGRQGETRLERCMTGLHDRPRCVASMVIIGLDLVTVMRWAA